MKYLIICLVLTGCSVSGSVSHTVSAPKKESRFSWTEEGSIYGSSYLYILKDANTGKEFLYITRTQSSQLIELDKQKLEKE